MDRGWRQWEDLPPEREEELIEKLARFFASRGIGTLAKIALEGGGPLTSLFAKFYLGIYGPYFEFLGIDEYVALLRKRKNVVKLIKRIEELEEQISGDH